MKSIIIRTLGAALNALSYFAPRRAGVYGFALFCSPFRVPINAKQRAFLDTAFKSSFDHKGIRIQAYRWGSGPKRILLLHGWQSHTYRWKKYIESLDLREYTVHAFDAPGHGLSAGRSLHLPLYGEIITLFIKETGPMECVIGHSLGSLAALYCFHNNEGFQANSLVTLAPPGEVEEFVQFFKDSLSLSQRVTEQIKLHFNTVFGKLPADFSAPVFASSVSVPGLIIHDEEDAEAPVRHARRIHAAWKDSHFIITRGLGHNLRSEEVVRDVLRFVHQTTRNGMVLT